MMTNPTVSRFIAIRKVRLVWAFAVLGAIAGVLLVAGRAHAESLGFSLDATPAPGTTADDLSILVLDDETGKALGGASVVVSESIEDADDAASLRGTTGAQGTLFFPSALARGPRAITVGLNGYASLSIVGLQSSQVTLHLKALPTAKAAADPTVLASGEMTAWPGKAGSNTLTAGIVFRSLSAMDLLSFSTDSFISPLKDTIDVMGPRQLPSNFAIPTQDISVYFMPIRVSKPAYRLPVARDKPVRLAGVQGNIPVNDLLSAFQGGGSGTGKMMALLNRLTFTHAGLGAETVPTNDFKQDVNASLKLKPQHQVTPVAPPFAADILVAAATDMDGTRSVLLPTDVKLAAELAKPTLIKPVKLSAPEAAGSSVRNVLTVALADKGHRVSGIVTPQAGQRVSPGAFLMAEKLADVASVPESVKLAPLPGGLSAVMYEGDASTAVWTVYALPGASVSQVPARGLPASAQVASYSVTGFELGSGFDGRNLDGRKALVHLQRFTRSMATVGEKPKP
jgi:hypothetical protein